MRPFMLPVFFYGGQISKALESSSLNAAQLVALTEIRSLLTWLLLQLGIVSRDQADALLSFTPLPRPATLEHRTGARVVVGVCVWARGDVSVLGAKRTGGRAQKRSHWAAQGHNRQAGAPHHAHTPVTRLAPRLQPALPAWRRSASSSRRCRACRGGCPTRRRGATAGARLWACATTCSSW
jgi:hypothetical protein